MSFERTKALFFSWRWREKRRAYFAPIRQPAWLVKLCNKYFKEWGRGVCVLLPIQSKLFMVFHLLFLFLEFMVWAKPRIKDAIICLCVKPKKKILWISQTLVCGGWYCWINSSAITGPLGEFLGLSRPLINATLRERGFCVALCHLPRPRPPGRRVSATQPHFQLKVK